MAKAEKQNDPGDMTFEQFVKRAPELTVLTDQPLTAEDTEETFTDDPFNFRYKLGPVFDILRYRDPVPKKKGKVEQRDLRTPVAILISGGWGTGKTSAMKWIEKCLKGWEPHAGSKGARVRPVWFYPWKYDNKEDVRRGLIAEVIINSIDVKTASTQTVINAAKQFGLFLGKSFLHVLASIKLKGQVSTGAGATKAGAGAEVDLASIKEILSEYQQAAHPEKAFLNEFERTLESWVKNTLGKDERMVIFIDDLDRCMPEIALQVLEALKLYLNIEKLIFVLGVDKEVVGRLVVEHYRKLGLVDKKEKDELSEDKDRRLRAEDKARLYLSKMFQVEIELSPTQQQVRDFLDKHLGTVPYWSDKLSTERQRLFRGLVLTLAGRNPREVKRILNSALMSGAGIQMMKAEKGKPRPTFEQGLQDFFIRRILQRPYYERIAGMIDTDEGRSFLNDWSQFVLEQVAADPDRLNDQLPDYARKPQSREGEDK